MRENEFHLLNRTRSPEWPFVSTTSKLAAPDRWPASGTSTIAAPTADVRARDGGSAKSGARARRRRVGRGRAGRGRGLTRTGVAGQPTAAAPGAGMEGATRSCSATAKRGRRQQGRGARGREEKYSGKHGTVCGE